MMKILLILLYYIQLNNNKYLYITQIMVYQGRKRYDSEKSYNAPRIWIQDKKKNDQVTGDLWRVHGKIYDLKKFIDEHPGGRYWLEITKGQDITDFFETSHINIQKAKKILQKYYVQDQKHPSFTAFTYKQDGFYNSLKKKVLKIFQTQQSRRPSSLMTISSYFFLLLWFVSFYFLGKDPSVFTVLLHSYLLYYLIGVGHNFSHQNNKIQYFMDFTSIPHKDWIISHCLSHHTFSNLEIDYQIIAFEPFLYFLTSQKKNNSKLSLIYQFIVFFLIPLQSFIESLISIYRNKAKIQSFLWLAQPLILCLVFSHSLIYSLFLWFIVHGISTIFLTSSFPTHRSSDIWTEGDPEQTQDFGIHILKTTGDHNKNMNNLLSMMLFQGFTDHSAHHMFPTIDRSKLYLINPLIEQTCREFKISKLFKEREYRQLFINYFPHLVRDKTLKRS